MEFVAGLIARPDTPESVIDDVIMSNLPPLAGEPQRDITVVLAIQIPERLKGPSELIPTLASKP